MSQHDNSLIKTPRQLIIVITLAFIVPVILIILLATYVVRSTTSGSAGSDAMSEKAIANACGQWGWWRSRMQAAPKSLQTGEAVYAAACSACHAAGIAGAPRTGDAAAWAPRIKQGFDLLVKHAVEGFKAMPPKGGNSNLDSIEVARAVAFMGNQSGGKIQGASGTGGHCSAAPAAAPSAASAAAVDALRHPPQLPAQRAPRSPRRSMAPKFMRRVATCVTPPALPAHRSSVTRQLGRHALDRASTR